MCYNLLIQIDLLFLRSQLANYIIIYIMFSWIFLNLEFYFKSLDVAFDKFSIYFSTFAGLSHVSQPPAPISLFTFLTHYSKACSYFNTIPFWESMISSPILLQKLAIFLRLNAYLQYLFPCYATSSIYWETLLFRPNSASCLSSLISRMRRSEQLTLRMDLFKSKSIIFPPIFSPSPASLY